MTSIQCFPWKSFYDEETRQHFSPFLKVSSLLCNSSNPRSGCTCHDSCEVYNNCCIDKYWKENMTMDKYKSLLIEKSKKANRELDKMEKIDVLPSFVLTTKEKKTSIRAIVKCESNADKEDIVGCMNPRNISRLDYTIPVLGGTGYFYKNSFCAKCNFVRDFAYINLTAYCRFDDIPTFDRLRESNSCSLTKIPDTSKGCVVRSCSNTSNEYYSLCRSYKGFVSLHENIDCARCNGITLKYRPNQCSYQTSWYHIVDISSTVNNLRTAKREIEDTFVKEDQTVKYCIGDKIMDVVTGNCVDIICGYGYRRIGATCIKVKRDLLLLPSNQICGVEKNFTLTFKRRKTNIAKIVKTFSRFLKMKNVSNQIQYDSITVQNISLQILQSIIRSRAGDQIWQYAEEISIPLREDFALDYGGSNISSYKKSFLCAVSEIKIHPIHNLTCENLLLDQNMTILEIVFRPNNTVYNVTTCKNFYLNSDCLLRKVKEFSIFDNRSLSIPGNGLLSIEEYIPHADGVYVCFHTKSNQLVMENPEWRKQIEHISEKISITGTSVSVLCYIYLLHHFVKSGLENTAQQNMAALCFSLLLTDSLFLIIEQLNQFQIACYIAGVVFHWLLLVVNMFVLIIAYEFAVTFRKRIVQRQTQNRKRFFSYCCVALLIPTLTVTITTLFDQFHFVDIGYGGDNLCWMTNYYAKLISYVIPFVLTCIIASGALLNSLKNIRAVSRLSGQMTIKSRKKDVRTAKIGFHMIMLLGLIEVFGVIQIRRDILTKRDLICNTVFQMFFTVLRSFRGIIWLLLVRRAKSTSPKSK